MSPVCECERGAARTRGDSRLEMQWARDLPPDFAEAVRRPVDFERHVEPSLPAQKVHGFDARGRRCYYHHSYVLSTFCADDEFAHPVRRYAQIVSAWRLGSGRWLTCTVELPAERECGRGCPHYEILDTPPR